MEAMERKYLVTYSKTVAETYIVTANSAEEARKTVMGAVSSGKVNIPVDDKYDVVDSAVSVCPALVSDQGNYPEL